MSDAPQSAGLDSSGSTAAGAWNAKKFREESELVKSRLSDQKFKISEWSNLVPQQGVAFTDCQ